MKRFSERLSYQMGKHTKPKTETIYSMILPSVLGIILCMICLAGTTWAWYTGSASTGAADIQTASFSVETQVSEESGTTQQEADGSYALLENVLYQVQLTVGNTATTRGYVLIHMGEDTRCTPVLDMKDTLTFYIRTAAAVSLSFEAAWGTNTAQTIPQVDDGDTVSLTQTSDSADPGAVDSPQPTEPATPAPSAEPTGTVPSDDAAEPDPTAVVHTVAQGDTLYDIAMTYDTTISRIVAYNELENPDALQIGQELRIPPADRQQPVQDGSPADLTDEDATDVPQE